MNSTLNRVSLVAKTVKNLLPVQEDLGLIPGLEACPRERNGNPLQYPCLENRMDKGAWWATVYGVPKRRTY